SLGDWLASEGVPAITGIDTRTLTKKLRERGTMRGRLVPEGASAKDADARAIDMQREVFRAVAPKDVVRYAGAGEGKRPESLLIDAGAKDNIVRSLIRRGADVVRAPWWHPRLGELAAHADGVMIGNGPGDPKDLAPLVESVRGLLQS